MKIATIFLLLFLSTFMGFEEQSTDYDTDKIKTISDFGILWGAIKFRSNAPHDLIDSSGAEYLQKILENDEESHIQQIFTQFLSEFDPYMREKIGNCGCVKMDNLEKYGPVFWTKLQKSICGESLNRVKFREGNIPSDIQFKYKDYFFDKTNPHLNLMPLFFYWNAIQYLYAYHDEMTTDWVSLLPVYVEKILLSNSKIDYDFTLMEMVTTMNDAHSFPFSVMAWIKLGLGGYVLSAETVFLPENKVYVDDPGIFQTGLQRGDQIISIDSKSIDKLMDRYRPYSSGGREIVTSREILTKCTQSKEKEHVYDIVRQGKSLQVKVLYYTWEEIKKAYQSDTTTLEKLNANTCYLDFRKITKENYTDVFEQASEYKTLILDMRSYPYVDFINILNECILNEKKKFTLFENQDPKNIGCFEIDSTSNNCYTSPSKKYRKKPFKSRIIGLVNYRTQSHTEYLLQMLKTYDDFVSVGNNTAGADGNVIRLDICYKFNVMFSVVKVIDLHEGVTNGIGLTPDYKVSVREPIEEDAVLKKALKLAE